MRLLIVVVAFFCCTASTAAGPFSSAYGSLVDDAGTITLPSDFRDEWAFLGTWSIAEKDVERSNQASGHGAAGLHNVYTQRGVAEYFRQHGDFPDGAVIVKELLKAATAPMTTGTVSRGTEVEGWFVMVKDTDGRFSANPLWGDGWGWVLLGPDGKLKTKDYKAECLGCHIPAKNTDWIYVDGYPVLR